MTWMSVYVLCFFMRDDVNGKAGLYGRFGLADGIFQGIGGIPADALIGENPELVHGAPPFWWEMLSNGVLWCMMGKWGLLSEK